MGPGLRTAARPGRPELDLAAVLAARPPAYREISRTAARTARHGLVVDQKLELQTLLDGILANRPPLVQEIKLFDVYTGKGIEPGKKVLLSV